MVARVRSRSIRARLLALFSIVFILIAALGAAGASQLVEADRLSRAVTPVSAIHAMSVDIAGTLHSLESDLEAYVVIGGPEQRIALEADLEDLELQLAALLEKAHLEPDLGRALVPLVESTDHLRVDVLLVLNSAEGDQASGIERLADIFHEMSEAQGLFRAFSLKSLAEVTTAVDEQHALLETLNAQFLGVGVAVLVIVGLASLFVTRSVRRLRAVKETAIAIAAGELHRELAVDGTDEIDQLAAAFNSMTRQLNALIDDLEARVQRRTEELTVANAALTEEVGHRERAEVELQAYAARLEQSNEALSEFAYVASHDLQEPLRKVQSFGSRLEAKYADRLDERGLDYLTRMQNAAARMQGLIEALLDYSRVTSQGRTLEIVSLADVAKEVVADLEVRLSEENGRVIIDDLPTIEADPLQMRQLFQNVIGNALKYRKPGQPALVSVQSHSLGGPAGLWQISITDNGIGFDGKYGDRIFGLFERLQGRGEYEGTGIGLAVCRKIVERHNGTITATSEPGEGAVFVVTLPTTQS